MLMFPQEQKNYSRWYLSLIALHTKGLVPQQDHFPNFGICCQILSYLML